MTTEMTEDEIEKQQVEQVFCLTGGELATDPVIYTSDLGEGRFRYTYEGCPTFAAGDHRDRYDEGVEYLTAVVQVMFSALPQNITIGDKGYVLVNTYASSGETECCYHQDQDEDPFKGQTCPYCTRPPGEGHGHIYLGDGWCEAVYRHQETP